MPIQISDRAISNVQVGGNAIQRVLVGDNVIFDNSPSDSVLARFDVTNNVRRSSISGRFLQEGSPGDSYRLNALITPDEGYRFTNNPNTNVVRTGTFSNFDTTETFTFTETDYVIDADSNISLIERLPNAADTGTTSAEEGAITTSLTPVVFPDFTFRLSQGLINAGISINSIFSSTGTARTFSRSDTEFSFPAGGNIFIVFRNSGGATRQRQQFNLNTTRTRTFDRDPFGAGTTYFTDTARIGVAIPLVLGEPLSWDISRNGTAADLEIRTARRPSGTDFSIQTETTFHRINFPVSGGLNVSIQPRVSRFVLGGLAQRTFEVNQTQRIV